MRVDFCGSSACQSRVRSYTDLVTDREPTASDRNRAAMLADLALVRAGNLMPTAAQLEAEAARQLRTIMATRLGSAS